jgi:hypothetical protein
MRKVICLGNRVQLVDMDDFNATSLHESKNEWGARLVTLLTPLIVEGLRSVFDSSVDLCVKNHEESKVLMTFQNLLKRIPKWNASIVETERKRIIERSGCAYLEDLVTCIHIIQLKLLSAMRAGQRPKKVDIEVPKLDEFLHKVYIHAARKVYSNVYLFDPHCDPLQRQKNLRELEQLVQECILNAVRESIPVENLLHAYLDETVEDDIVEEIKEQVLHPPPAPASEPLLAPEPSLALAPSASTPNPLASPVPDAPRISPSTTSSFPSVSSEGKGRLAFNDIDSRVSSLGEEEHVLAPKTVERLEEVSVLRNMQRKWDEAALGEDESDDEDRLHFTEESVSLDSLVQAFPDDLLV